MTKHKHRIIPGHMGGTYDPENVVMLTREEHAEAHMKLYEEHGREEDLWAAQMLGQPQASLAGENNPNWKGGIWSYDRTKYWRERRRAQGARPRTEAQKGQNNNNWKGGISGKPGTPERAAYQKAYTKEWRRKRKELENEQR